MGLAEAYPGHIVTNQQAPGSSHDLIWSPRGTVRSVWHGFVSVYKAHEICLFNHKFRPDDWARSPHPQAPLDKFNQSKWCIVSLWHQHQRCLHVTSKNSFFQCVCLCSVSTWFEPSTGVFPIPRIRAFSKIPTGCFVSMFNYYMSWAWFISFTKIMHLTRVLLSSTSPFFLPLFSPKCC